jgi:murein DD-endopeptidase MepM/ murein hydrolase activator NlpD
MPGQSTQSSQSLDSPTRTPFLPPTRLPGAPILTPTPDDPHAKPAVRTEPDQYSVQPGDTLGIIAQRYGVSLEELIQANDLSNPNILDVGQVITVPVPTPQGLGTDFKVIPDSELVYGPASADFNIEAFIKSKGGYLTEYQEDINEDGKLLTGVQIVQRIAQDYSVNPRILLSVLQYQSGWLTKSKADLGQGKIDFPMGVREEWRKGLYSQLAWAANTLNRGYYLWRASAAATWLLGDGSVVPIAATINPGTAGVQHLFATLYGRGDWEQAVGPDGVFAVYNTFFGYPFDYAIEPLLPPGLSQPPMKLPFESGQAWAYTGGPHGGWGDGSAWAALDFAPPTDALGCILSNDWVTAAADGLILRAEDGAVIQDLDGDGYEQTGWVVLYMHVESRERVLPGTLLKAGEHIGHPSCEGGVSSGTHVHLARRYNGEWIPADQTLPFILDGWVSRGAGKEYDGYLEKDGHKVEAYAGRSADNAIQR